MGNVQISQELFMQLLRFHLVEDESCEREIKQELEKKLDRIRQKEAHLCINNTRLMVSFLKAFTDKNKTVQLFYSTHSTEFINKMNLKNVVVLHNGKAYSFADELEDEDFAYLAKKSN